MPTTPTGKTWGGEEILIRKFEGREYRDRPRVRGPRGRCDDVHDEGWDLKEPIVLVRSLEIRPPLSHDTKGSSKVIERHQYGEGIRVRGGHAR
jgi:hypothetical protein